MEEDTDESEKAVPVKKNSGGREAIVLAVGVLVTLGAFAFPLLERVYTQLGLKQIPFEQAQWNEMGRPAAMSCDLVGKEKLVGMTEEQIVDMLGKPDRVANNPRQFEYKLRGLFYQLLVLTVKGGKVVKVGSLVG